MRALVIDDSRAIIGKTLRDLGIEVVEAGNGREALDRLSEDPDVELALVDWNMPVMDGLGFVVEARKELAWRRMTLMMVTTESEHLQIVRALASGAHEYVVKPFSADSIATKLALLGLVPVGVPNAT